MTARNKTESSVHHDTLEDKKRKDTRERVMKVEGRRNREKGRMVWEDG